MRVFVTHAESGQIVKALPENFASTYVYHPQFGFVSESGLRARVAQRSRAGFSKSRIMKASCKFDLREDFTVEALENCEVHGSREKGWKLKTPAGEVFIQRATQVVVPTVESEANEDRTFRKVMAAAILLLLLLAFALMNYHPSQDASLTAAQEKLIIKAVKIVKPPVVKAPIVAPTEESVPKDVAQPKTKTKTVAKALPKNLGFLGIAGSKELKKALGGIPTSPTSSPGAGPGGKEGSGGELLAGLGQGVRRTTVGNTGTVGLGGIGTKGKGGGGGGYGTALVGAGDGKAALSKLAMTEDIILDGGLDRATINATIAKYLSEVRACYEKGLEGNPGLQGQVNMAFEIGASGHLNFARVAKSTLGSALVEGCISKRMINWKFPKPVGGVNVKVNYPFSLRPVGT